MLFFLFLTSALGATVTWTVTNSTTWNSCIMTGTVSAVSSAITATQWQGAVFNGRWEVGTLNKYEDGISFLGTFASSGAAYTSQSAAYVHTTSYRSWTPSGYVDNMGLSMTDDGAGTGLTIVFTAEMNNKNFPFAREIVVVNSVLMNQDASQGHAVSNYFTYHSDPVNARVDFSPC
jgi:hypothetical protein